MNWWVFVKCVRRRRGRRRKRRRRRRRMLIHFNVRCDESSLFREFVRGKVSVFLGPYRAACRWKRSVGLRFRFLRLPHWRGPQSSARAELTWRVRLASWAGPKTTTTTTKSAPGYMAFNATPIRLRSVWSLSACAADIPHVSESR